MKKNSGSTKKIIAIVIVYILLDALSRLPYLNVILSPWVTYAILWVFIVFLYKLNFRWSFLLCFGSMIFALVSEILQRGFIAENIGNFIFLIFLIGAAQFLFYTLNITRKLSK